MFLFQCDFESNPHSNKRLQTTFIAQAAMQPFLISLYKKLQQLYHYENASGICNYH